MKNSAITERTRWQNPARRHERLNTAMLLYDVQEELNEMQQRAMDRSVEVPRSERPLVPVCEALKKVGLA